MFWPFRRRKSRSEEAVTFVLERAASLAAGKQQEDEEFGVTLKPSLQRDAAALEIITAIERRAFEYEVCPRYVVDWTFYFTKVDPNRT